MHNLAYLQAIYWCVVVGTMLIFEITFDSISNGFETLPSVARWISYGMLLLVITLLCVLSAVRRARAYTAYLLTVGTCLMTCYLAYRVDCITTSTSAFIVMAEWPAGKTGTLVDILVPTPKGLIGAWFFVLGLLVNTAQCSIVCSIGLVPNAVCAVVSALVFTVAPSLSANNYGSLFYVVPLPIIGLCLFPNSVSITLQAKSIEYQRGLVTESQLRELAYQKASQKADGLLYHILKNHMVDARSAIDLVLDGESQTILSDARDLLVRSVWWCALREAVQRIVQGTYVSEVRNVALCKFCRDILVGRPAVILDCPSVTASLDPLACSVVLDNAVANAFRHGCSEDEEVKLKVEVPSDGRSGALSFTLTNRAKAGKRKLERWSASNTENVCVSSPTAQYESLSTGLGLHHIAVAVNTCDMSADLWQEEEYVHFRLCLDTQVSQGSPTRPDSTTIDIPRGFHPNVHILCIDDSPIARKSLATILPSRIPGAVVKVFGETYADVALFKQAVAERCDVVIVDQNLSFADKEVYGTALIQEIQSAGYKGLAVIRSANCTAADQTTYMQSGAHCTIDKEIQWPEMVLLLEDAYATLVARSVSPPDTSEADRRASMGIASIEGCLIPGSVSYDVDGRA